MDRAFRGLRIFAGSFLSCSKVSARQATDAHGRKKTGEKFSAARHCPAERHRRPSGGLDRSSLESPLLWPFHPASDDQFPLDRSRAGGKKRCRFSSNGPGPA